MNLNKRLEKNIESNSLIFEYNDTYTYQEFVNNKTVYCVVDEYNDTLVVKFDPSEVKDKNCSNNFTLNFILFYIHIFFNDCFFIHMLNIIYVMSTEMI